MAHRQRPPGRAAAEPVSNVDNLTVISTDGASEVMRNVASNLEQGLQIGTDLTGVDLRSILHRVGGGAGDEDTDTVPPSR